MYIVINNDNISTSKSLKRLNKKLKTEFKKEDFKNFNGKRIVNIDNNDLDYKRDINELDRVFVQKLYKKDVSGLINYGFYIIILIILLIILGSVKSSSSMLLELISQLESVL